MGVAIEINDAVFAQFDKELAGLKQTARMPAIKKGIKSGLKVTETRYEDYVPRSTDRTEGKHLVETISSKVKEYSSGTIVGLVGAEYPAGAQAHLIEGGVEPHEITTEKKGLANKATNQFFGKKVNHPGFEGRHYLEAAVRDTEGERDAAMVEGMKKAVEEAKRG